MVPFHFTEGEVIPPHNAVGRDEQIKVSDPLNELVSLETAGTMVNTDLEVRYEALRLPRPVAHHRCGCNDECGSGFLTLFGFNSQQGEKLQGLAQAHVIRKHSAELIT